MAAYPLTVGFDLDMTLIDSRPGIKAAYEELAARTGTYIDAEAAVTRLGPPLEEEIRRWFPEERVAEASGLYRELYPEYGITPTLAMRGAREAIAAVQAAGVGAGHGAQAEAEAGTAAGTGTGAPGRAIVVTAKYEPNAKLHLAHLGIEPDAVIGSLWAEAKAEALREYGARIYVGDHTGDVRGARAAGAVSVAVATGPCDGSELLAAGADVVLGDLMDFPAWLNRYVAESLDGSGAPDGPDTPGTPDVASA
ncbi:putative hydrolase [Streptomyces sp. NBRC 110611]|uniref:HAD family hydrolase n=1 Tax=Streptomyces sp. NBRC 110611 TaxID=1621259 RepID=UPI0008324320|nr:HAD hydrolase-like protein [Streptomyces sp. NBRC 110611]GAU64813.1 putative hydrolase [Streptomyces sp. NBRC 110611]